MVHAKGAHCDDCCCADCGVRPARKERQCCYCFCDELCATLTMDNEPSPCDANCACDATADCPCVAGKGLLSWDADNCYWSGSIGCQSVTINIRVEPFNCGGTCYLCVTSACMSMAGDCATTTDCFVLDDCGEFRKDCDVMGGFSFNFTKDISGCSANCGDATITISCSTFVNPNYDKTENYEICQNCNCVCEFVCITYEEDGCSIKKLVQWDDGTNDWHATFEGECGWSAAQTVTVALVDDGTGCCAWQLSTTRGTVDAPNPVHHECPHPTLNWTLSGLTGASVDLECATCDECLVASCCPSLPVTLYARVCNPCGSWCVYLTLRAITSTTAVWRSETFTIQVTDSVDLTCEDVDIQIEAECVSSGTLWNVNIYCGGVLRGADTGLSVDCTPFCVNGSPDFGGNEGPCNYQGSSFYADTTPEICISEEPC